MAERKIDREKTFALIQEKSSDIPFDSISDKSDYYWQDVCSHLNILPVYQDKKIPIKE